MTGGGPDRESEAARIGSGNRRRPESGAGIGGGPNRDTLRSRASRSRTASAQGVPQSDRLRAGCPAVGPPPRRASRSRTASAAFWSSGADRFALAGPDGLVCFTTLRRRAIPAGEARAGQLRAAVQGAFSQRAVSGPPEPRAVVGMEQVHGGRIVKCAPDTADGVLPGCDGLVTDRPGVALVVRTADCLPVVAYDPSRRLLGVAHAGWRGLKAGIAGRLARAMGPGDLWAGVGPGIGSCCYEVGPEFDGRFPGHLRVEGGRPGKFLPGRRFLDLAGVAEQQLRAGGVAAGRILRAPWCTFCEKELCCSYRREGDRAGRMVTCAMMVE